MVYDLLFYDLTELVVRVVLFLAEIRMTLADEDGPVATRKLAGISRSRSSLIFD